MVGVTSRRPCPLKIRVYATFASINRLISEDGMTLHIRDDRAAELARLLAERKGVSLTEAIVHALEAALAQDNRPLGERIREIAAEAQRRGDKTKRRQVTKEEIDELWGHE